MIGQPMLRSSAISFSDRPDLAKECAAILILRLCMLFLPITPVFRSVSDKLNDTIYGGLTEPQKEQLETLLEHVY
ncbi:hypothetical protein AB6A23_08250 [Paenibacillus tarimensis]